METTELQAVHTSLSYYPLIYVAQPTWGHSGYPESKETTNRKNNWLLNWDVYVPIFEYHLATTQGSSCLCSFMWLQWTWNAYHCSKMSLQAAVWHDNKLHPPKHSQHVFCWITSWFLTITVSLSKGNVLKGQTKSWNVQNYLRRRKKRRESWKMKRKFIFISTQSCKVDFIKKKKNIKLPND